MNWNRVAPSLTRANEYDEWQKLKKYFGNQKITLWSLLEYQLVFNYPYKTLDYYLANRVSKHLGVKIPPQYATTVTPLKDYPNLDIFVTSIKSLCSSHSVYALTCAFFFYGKSTLYAMKASNGSQWYANAPKWLKVILDRQTRLCKNSYLKDDDPFFFLYSDFTKEFRPVNANDINFVSSLLEELLGFTIDEYVIQYRKFAGLTGRRIIFEGSNPDLYVELKMRRRRNILSPVTVFEWVNGERKAYTHGICLGEIEPGIYLVDSIVGKIVVPFYLLDMPRLTVSQPPTPALRALYDLGYIPEEDQVRITGLNKLTSYKVSNEFQI